MSARVGCVFAIAAIGLLGVTGCTDDDPPSGDSGSGSGVVTDPYPDPYEPEPEPTPQPSAIESLIENAAESNASTPGTGAAADDYDQVFSQLQEKYVAQESIASQLRSIDPNLWGGFEDLDVDEFIDTACLEGTQTAADDLMSKLPGADLRAAPAITQMVVLTVQDQRCQPADPQAVDELSNYLNSEVIANQQQSNLSVSQAVAAAPEPASGLSGLFRKACKAVGGVVRWAKRRVTSGGGGFVFSFGVAAGVVACPSFLESLF